MLKKILRKRIRMELEAWSEVQALMPRGKKTRGIQYEALEYLFEHLYERVSEKDLEAHLHEVRGQLQTTGDPVKGAINQAVKELQRLPDRTFEIVKIQEATVWGARRYVQMNFTRFEDVIGFEVFAEYLQEVLHQEKHVVVRGIGHLSADEPQLLFPGLRMEDLAQCRGHFLVNPIDSEKPSNILLSYFPASVATMRLLLIYEDEAQTQPFLGFIARVGQSPQDSEFILYRGSEKAAKLSFLDRTWHDLAMRAVNREDLSVLWQKARDLTTQLPQLEGIGAEGLLNTMLVKATRGPGVP